MLLSLVLALMAPMAASAMSYEEAREQALFLTDKMAYELNLNDEQYEYCYEINLDYLMGVQTADDVYGVYLTHRNADLRHILFDWQYSLFCAADYFFHPLIWHRGVWSLPIYRYYTYGHFFYHRPQHTGENQQWGDFEGAKVQKSLHKPTISFKKNFPPLIKRQYFVQKENDNETN